MRSVDIYAVPFEADKVRLDSLPEIPAPDERNRHAPPF
jgi:hypothetical protein